MFIILKSTGKKGIFYGILIFALGLINTLAPNSTRAQSVSCNEAVTTHDMMACENTALKVADKDLNKIYGALQNDLDEDGRLLLRNAQRAWISYRDAECARVSDFARGGKLVPLLLLSCKSNLTATRVIELSRNSLTGESN